MDINSLDRFLEAQERMYETALKEIKNGDFNELIEALMQKPVEELKELYNNREIEK